MHPLRASSSSGPDSDSDSPEAVSLSHSRRTIQKHNAEIRKTEALVREKAKLKNRQRDQKLKERAAKNKKDGPVSLKKKGKEKGLLEGDGDEHDSEGGRASNDVEARMLRAMRDAEGEGSEDEVVDGQDNIDGANDLEEFQEGSSFDRIDVDEDEEGDEDEDDEMESQEENSEDNEEDEEMGSDASSEPAPKSVPPKKSSNYLPDELFRAAFSQASKTQPSQSKSEKSIHSDRGQKKRKRTSTPKDIIVGSKAIRTLSSTPRPVSSRAAVPSANVNKFLSRALALKGQRPVPGKGWERRPAHIGVLRRNGPAAHFIRSRQ